MFRGWETTGHADFSLTGVLASRVGLSFRLRRGKGLFRWRGNPHQCVILVFDFNCQEQQLFPAIKGEN